MEKTLLIPIDFTVESLNTLKTALIQSEETGLEIILMHSELMSDSITELLFYSPEKIISSLMNTEFEKGLEILKNRFENKIHYMGIVVLNGRSMDMLEKFLKAYKVDKIYVPKHYKLKSTRNSFDPIPLLKKTAVPVLEMEWDTSQVSGKNHLDVLF